MPRGTGKSGATRGAKRASKGNGAQDVDGIEPVDHEGDAAARAKLLASDKLYYRIGEVSKLTGVKAHVLRYWETEFRWMAPPKSRSKQRLYRKRDIEFVWLLKRLLWEERYTIAGARQRIQELGVEEALALLDQPPGTSATKSEVEAAVQAASSEQWVSFRAALDEMESELLALRGVLQEGT
jgi:DNA-binding transcriptional MerR regulator